MDSDVSIEAHFAASFPLPFRVFVLINVGILCWATNLHGLYVFGIDATSALDIGSHDPHAYTGLILSAPRPSDTLALARSVYRLCCTYTFIVFCGWCWFRASTHGELSMVDSYKWIPAVTGLALTILIICPFNIAEKRVRDMFLLAIRRCFSSPSSMPIYFSDVILADTFTSFAKVIGDVWLSLCMISPGGSLLVFPSQNGWSRLLVPCLMSIPYAVRFRQCIIDYMQPTTTTKRSLYNALKYASSFPVIFLSAAQRTIAANSGDVEIEEHPLFKLWLLSVIVNSSYSFWWDISNDWGLEALKPKQEVPRIALRPLLLPTLQTRSSSLDGSPPTHARRTSLHGDSSYTISPRQSLAKTRYPWGLRPVLLYPLPAYPFAVFANLVLRLTWSLKLSSHLHAQVSGALLFFWLELAELLRRWLWVFFRVEWECVKNASEREDRGTRTPLTERHGVFDSEEYEIAELGPSRRSSGSSAGNVDTDSKINYRDGVS